MGLLIGLGLLVAGTVAFFAAQPGGEPEETTPRLLPGHRDQSNIGLESHFYRLAASAGDFLEITVEQRGIDLTVSLLNEAGQALAAIDGLGLGDTGTEVLPLVVEEAGTYRLEIKPTTQYGKPGRYVVRRSEARPPSPQDWSRAMATKELTRAGLLAEEGAFADASAALERALDHARKGGEPRQLANVLHRQGLLFYDTFQYEQALDVLGRAGEAYRNQGNLLGEAHALHMAGSALYYLDDFAGALEARQAAYDLYKKIGGVMGSLGQANARRGMAVIHVNRGNYDQAKAFYNEALNIWPSGIDEPGRIRVINDLGVFYLNIGNNDQARLTYRQALQQLEGLKPHASLACDKARALGGVGQSFTNQQRGAEALPYVQQALRLSNRCQDVDVYIPIMNQIGAAYLPTLSNRLHRYIARRALEWAFDHEDPARHPLDMANTYTGLAALELQTGRPEKAVTLFDQALVLRRERGDLLGVIGGLYGRTSAERASGDLRAAQSSIRESLALIEELRRKPGEDTQSADLFASRRRNYNLFISILMEQHEADPTGSFAGDAFEVNEQARARTLMDWLAGGQLADSRSPLVTDRERQLSGTLRTSSRQLAKLKRLFAEKPTADVQAQIESENRNYKEIELELGRIQAASRILDLEKSDPLTLAEIREQVLDEQTLLLAYWFGRRGEAGYLWAVDQDSIQVHSFSPEEVARIEALVPKVYLGLSQRDAASSKSVRDLAELSRLILSPVAPLLQNRRLLIVADGGLQSLPFPALQDPRVRPNPSQTAWSGYQPLADRHTVAMLPSASMLGVLRAGLEGREKAPKKLAVLYDPVFNFDDVRVLEAGTETETEGQERSGGLDATLQGLDRLEHTATEAEAILSLVDPGERFSATGFEADRSTVLRSGHLGQYEIVHFATHGIYDSEFELSGLALAGVRRDGLIRYGFLRASEISRLSLPVELVVLSACQTALGKSVPGEGVFNLSRAFFYAGARRVVVTHWNVDDEATAEFMKFFYEGMLIRKLEPSKALREAQREMRQNPEWAHPYYWGGFVLQGEW